MESRARDAKAVSEDALSEVLRAAGAKSADPEARRTLRALTERELARIATRAADEARARGLDTVNAESVALAASSLARERREFVEEED